MPDPQEIVTPLSSENPTTVELADAVRQLQRIVQSAEGTDLTSILLRLDTLESDFDTLEGTIANITEFLDFLGTPTYTDTTDSTPGESKQYNYVTLAGLTIKGGFIEVTSSDLVVEYTVPFTTCFGAWLQPWAVGEESATEQVNIENTAAWDVDGFTADSDGGTRTCKWIAVGLTFPWPPTP